MYLISLSMISSNYVAQVGPKLLTLMPQFPKDWDYMHLILGWATVS